MWNIIELTVDEDLIGRMNKFPAWYVRSGVWTAKPGRCEVSLAKPVLRCHAAVNGEWYSSPHGRVGYNGTL